MAKIETLEQYLATLDDTPAATVQAVIDAVQREFPDAALKMAWNVPQMQINGKYVMGISVARQHISISPWSNIAMNAYADRLAQYDPTENLFRVPVDWQVDAALLRDLIEMRLAEFE